MYLIIGLGNPTREYHHTRHNVGFDFIDYLGQQNNIEVGVKKHKAVIGQGYLDGQKVILAKPGTYMNLSGECVINMAEYYKADTAKELIIVYDDISLDAGQVRVKRKGSAGGHNGIKNILSHLKTDEFPRVKIGIGAKPKGYDLADYVLGHFSKEERIVIDEGIKRAAEAVRIVITGGIDKAMNEFNRKSGE